MLHCCLSVTTWYRFETVQRSGMKLYRMVGQDLGSYGAERNPKDGAVSEQWRLQWGTPVSRRPRYSNQAYFRFYLKKEASDSKNNGTLL